MSVLDINLGQPITPQYLIENGYNYRLMGGVFQTYCKSHSFAKYNVSIGLRVGFGQNGKIYIWTIEPRDLTGRCGGTTEYFRKIQNPTTLDLEVLFKSLKSKYEHLR